MTNILCYNQSYANILSDIKTITAPNAIESLSNFDIFKGISINHANKYATLESDFWRLDGSYKLIDTDKPVTGAWLGIVSGNSPNFNKTGYPYPTPASPTGIKINEISIEFNNYHTKWDIDGLTLIFADELNYAKHIVINLYYDDTRIQTWNTYSNLNVSSFFTISFADVDDTVTSDENDVNYKTGRFNKIYISFMTANRPNRFVKLADIKFAYANFILSDDNFYDLSLLEEMSLVSDTIPINTLKYTVKADTAYIKGLSQCKYVELYNNQSQFGSFYLDNIVKNAVDNYTIYCTDSIGVLDKTALNENLFMSIDNTLITVKNVIDYIMDGTSIVYRVDDIFADSQISIRISAATKREGLAQILLVSNGVCKKERNGSLWFGRLNTSLPIADITENIFNDYRIEDKTPVSSLQLSETETTSGAEFQNMIIDDWYIKEQTKDYMIVASKSLPFIISSVDCLVSFQFIMVFYQDLDGVPSVEEPYNVATSVRNYKGSMSTTPGAGKYLPDKINISPTEISVRIDTKVVSLHTPSKFGARPKNNVGEPFGGDMNYYEADKYWTQNLDFTKAKLVMDRTYYPGSFNIYKGKKLNLATSDNIISVSNPNTLTNRFNQSNLSIQTIEFNGLKIAGQTDNTIDLLMSRYYQYNKEFSGTILTRDLMCGDTVKITLPDIGEVTGTITQLDYMLTNKLIAKAKIFLYYKEV